MARSDRRGAAAGDDLFDRYVDTAPSAQNAIDAAPGWTTALPPEFGVTAGPMALTADTRIAWAVGRLGGVAGLRVLELGPLDGGHTYMLHAAGAARIDAIEANRLAFLRCLVLKEVTGLDRARFHLGDFTRGFGPVDGRFDLILASGVLYHLQAPTLLIEAIAARADALYLWTHVVDPAGMPPGDPRLVAFTGEVSTATLGGVPVRLHERRYHGAHHAVGFCGGARDRHVWMEREGLLAGLGALGFDSLEIAHEDPGAPSGPALSILARRTGSAGSPGGTGPAAAGGAGSDGG
jgi:hypothetical protein